MAVGLNAICGHCVLAQTLPDKWLQKLGTSPIQVRECKWKRLSWALQTHTPAVHPPHAYRGLCGGNKPELSRGWYRTNRAEGKHKSKETAFSCIICCIASATEFDTYGHTCAALTLPLTYLRMLHCVESAFLKQLHRCSYVCFFTWKIELFSPLWIKNAFKCLKNRFSVYHFMCYLCLFIYLYLSQHLVFGHPLWQSKNIWRNKASALK